VVVRLLAPVARELAVIVPDLLSLTETVTGDISPAPVSAAADRDRR
jgi:hypothetical protein